MMNRVSVSTGVTTRDPRKLLDAAARLMTAVGWIHGSIGLGFVFLGVRAWQVALTGGCLLAGGATLLVSGHFTAQHRRWAIQLGIGAAFLLGVAFALLLTLLVVLVGWHDLVQGRSPLAVPAVLLLLVFVFVHVMIVRNLSKSFDDVNMQQLVKTGAGFEPIVSISPLPVLPVDSDDAPRAERRRVTPPFHGGR
jgi:hypothetical protein